MKILYRMSQLPHQRVFERLVPVAGIDQIIVGPPEPAEDMPNYGYDDFMIQNIVTYSNNNELVKIIKDFNPDVYVDSVLSFFRRKAVFNSIPKDCKLAYLHHGFCGKGSVPTFKLHDRTYNRDWMRNASKFSVACGGIKYFRDWMGELGLGADKIILNAVPQTDLICDSNYYNSRKPVVMSKLGLDPAMKTILFFGRLAGPGKEFNQTNKEFFDTLFELHEIAYKHNVLLMVKPKIRVDKIEWFLKTHMRSHYKNIYPKFKDLLSSKNIYMIDTERHAYQYFFADAVVLNGASSVELEAVIANKPVITINTVKNIYVDDVYDVGLCKATVGINSVCKLEDVIVSIFNGGFSETLYSGREKLLEYYNIVTDGCAVQRAQDAVVLSGVK